MREICVGDGREERLRLRVDAYSTISRAEDRVTGSRVRSRRLEVNRLLR